ncbi:hypothetical protein N7450_010142 [Penicillium hetheringtonii]|uniref:Uncharacterized protein n=1 Tax=Penicillium hetheringtonii TaxID=911720 RepID=A0AAD6GP25_9EURO|nr:hypothetical protein N7450_010142 [Penicillium hetheringtonii]
MPQTTVPGNIFAKEMRIVDRFIDQGAVFVAKVEYMAERIERDWENSSIQYAREEGRLEEQADNVLYFAHGSLLED